MTDDNLFLTAVEELTKPIRSKVIQDGPVGSGLAGQHTVTVELPPLLTQLENAIRGSNVKGSSGSLAHQRNLIDADALYRFMKISSTVKEWARMVGAVIDLHDPAVTLVRWYIVYNARSVTLDQERFYIRQMNGWAAQIRDKLNPPKVWEVPGDCPACGADTWWSRATHEEYKFPLVTEYDPEAGANLVQAARSMCRACEQVWSVRELAYAIEQKTMEVAE